MAPLGLSPFGSKMDRLRFRVQWGTRREFSSNEIDLALQNSDPYDAMNYNPAWFEDPLRPGSHGTHVMDIAAGNGNGTGVMGMAPRSRSNFC